MDAVKRQRLKNWGKSSFGGGFCYKAPCSDAQPPIATHARHDRAVVLCHRRDDGRGGRLPRHPVCRRTAVGAGGPGAGRTRVSSARAGASDAGPGACDATTTRDAGTAYVRDERAPD